MKFEIIDESNVCVIKTGESFDRFMTSDLKSQVNDLIEKGTNKILFDLEKTNFVDSLGLGLMLAISKSLKKENGQLKISSVTTNIKNLFELTKLNQYFEIFDNKEEALKSFK